MRTAKYEFFTPGHLVSLTQWFDRYNQERFHQSLDNQTLNEIYL